VQSEVDHSHLGTKQVLDSWKKKKGSLEVIEGSACHISRGGIQQKQLRAGWQCRGVYRGHILSSLKEMWRSPGGVKGGVVNDGLGEGKGSGHLHIGGERKGKYGRIGNGGSALFGGRKSGGGGGERVILEASMYEASMGGHAQMMKEVGVEREGESGVGKLSVYNITNKGRNWFAKGRRGLVMGAVQWDKNKKGWG